jgi:hypothetical protein
MEDILKPLVFISHIHSESEVAIWIKESINKLLLGGIDFFVSSDRSTIVGGDRWLEKIESSLKNASIVLILCSKISILRPWVNFEAGGAWMANKRVIPICHSGLSHNDLLQPLASLQAYTLSNQEDLNNLVGLLAKAAKLNTPNFDPNELLKTLPKNEIDSINDNSEKILNDNNIGTLTSGLDIHDVRALRSNYNFDKRTGIHKHIMTDEPVCTACLLQGIESPLTESDEGWRCNNRGCDKFYFNPNFSPPGTEDMEDDPTY